MIEYIVFLMVPFFMFLCVFPFACVSVCGLFRLEWGLFLRLQRSQREEKRRNNPPTNKEKEKTGRNKTHTHTPTHHTPTHTHIPINPSHTSCVVLCVLAPVSLVRSGFASLPDVHANCRLTSINRSHTQTHTQTVKCTQHTQQRSYIHRSTRSDEHAPFELMFRSSFPVFNGCFNSPFQLLSHSTPPLI